MSVDAPAPSSSPIALLRPERCKRFVVAKHPEGMPDETLWKLEEVTVPNEGDGLLLLKPEYISVDPYLRLYPHGLGAVGSVQKSFMVAEIVESKHQAYQVGERLYFNGDWQTLQSADPAGAHALWRRVNPHLAPSLTAWLGVLGMPGGTAYFGTKKVMGVNSGDVILVSGAAGAVGSTVGQLCKAWGAKTVVGVAGGPEKCKLLTEKLGFDHAVDYKAFDTKEKMHAELQRLAPGGFDAYFDNVGGHTTAAAVQALKKGARVAICGQISQYNKPESEKEDISKWREIGADESVSVKSVMWLEHKAQWDEFESEIGELLKSGKLRIEETVVEGFEKLPEAFLGLFKGENKGKMVVKV